jgi:hypothetical protein
MCAARATELKAKYADSAKERQKSVGGSGKKAVPVNLPEAVKGDTRDQLGKMFGVSGKSVDHAARVLEHAEPEVVKAVDEGRMGISTAAILATEPEEVQRAEASGPRHRRDYKSCSKPLTEAEKQEEEEAEEGANGKPKGVGT